MVFVVIGQERADAGTTIAPSLDFIFKKVSEVQGAIKGSRYEQLLLFFFIFDFFCELPKVRSIMKSRRSAGELKRLV